MKDILLPWQNQPWQQITERYRASVLLNAASSEVLAFGKALLGKIYTSGWISGHRES